MRTLSQILGAFIEAWGEVKVQKARVILSLIGVVAAVAAMSTVIALGNVMQQSMTEVQEAFEGRSITLNISVSQTGGDQGGALLPPDPGLLAGGDPAAMAMDTSGAVALGQTRPMETPATPHNVKEGDDPSSTAPSDPVGQAMKTVADRFKIPYWSRMLDDNSVQFREFVEASNSGQFRGKPIITDEFTQYVPAGLKAVDPDYAILYRMQVTHGRWLHESDWLQRVSPVVMNSVMWDMMGQPDIRDTIVLHANDDSERQFRVVGVTKAKSRFDPPVAFISYESWTYMNTGQPGQSAQPSMLVWVGEEQVAQARRMIPSAVAGVLGPQWSGVVFGGEGFDSGQQELERTNNIIMVISVIVVFLGALGLLNVAIVTVRQRIREIGIRRAMGASAVRVFFAVFLESVVATFVAGVIGVAIAVGVFRYVPLESLSIFLQDKPGFPMTAAFAGVAISTAIGALCGIIPAVAAVRVKPIDAIRF